MLSSEMMQWNEVFINALSAFSGAMLAVFGSFLLDNRQDKRRQSLELTARNDVQLSQINYFLIVLTYNRDHLAETLRNHLLPFYDHTRKLFVAGLNYQAQVSTETIEARLKKLQECNGVMMLWPEPRFELLTYDKRDTIIVSFPRIVSGLVRINGRFKDLQRLVADQNAAVGAFSEYDIPTPDQIARHIHTSVRIGRAMIANCHYLFKEIDALSRYLLEAQEAHKNSTSLKYTPDLPPAVPQIKSIVDSLYEEIEASEPARF